MLPLARKLAREALVGAIFGALLLGVGGRAVMRLLANLIDRDPAFSLGGSIEVIAYGAILGSVSGAAFAAIRHLLPVAWQVQGLLLASLSYAGAIATLPAHIAETARPFAGSMALVLLLFGLCFLSFGLATAYVSSRASSRARGAAPAAPPG